MFLLKIKYNSNLIYYPDIISALEKFFFLNNKLSMLTIFRLKCICIVMDGQIEIKSEWVMRERENFVQWTFQV